MAMATFCYHRTRHSALLLLIIAASAGVFVECTSSLNPVSIGIRSAITRGPLGYGASSSSPGLPSQQRRKYLTRIGRCNEGPQFTDAIDSCTETEDEDICLPINTVNRGGSAAAAAVAADRRLHFWEAMICGAISRSAAQTIMHPANTMKTILQSSRRGPEKTPLSVMSFTKWKHAKHLTRGAGAQLILSIPHGAVNFAVLEFVRRQMNVIVSQSRYADAINRNFGPGMDFLSSALSTICCSVVSTPQMMICDNIMAGTYPNLFSATKNLMKDKGVAGFYTGWWPGIAGKIPSYGLTWTLFEQIKRMRNSMSDRPAKDIENSIMGCMASATTVCVMIPMDTVKTRLVTQLNYPDLVPYNGINDCFKRVLKEEGIGAFYRGLTPRLLSVVPMIGIQFGFYEFTKKLMLAKDHKTSIEPARGRMTKAEMKRREEEAEEERSREARLLQEMAMEVAADDDQPFPAPFPKKKGWWAKK
mmetsp:Transcript_25359/g.43287  ORF Transcript_25359/g.43287 Transcript_25359/m.43287 type:complete len:474 (-) Transcript_25359:118-1539(-)|eukprot:CAMPEP_0183737370 /NCGR_PEP_ID=MMETSP0737-20130205/51726_1 /TAXON_ID=385413 /ORGANISM="Thalassiosira miniscula, Strain CCMP1093" /LENGTH=473 /DNA_ID=CAMNT_0025971621 /DNA_START=35 /DNA_END=1456 /DNA_ORIENTATION=+